MTFIKMLQWPAIVLALFLTACSSHQNNMAAGGNKTQVLINGEQGLENWAQLGDANWHAENGAIVADSGKGFLVTPESYDNFRLVIEFWADHTTNSGIFIRMSDSKNVDSDNAYEVNIFDQRPDPLYGTGAIVDVAKVDPMPKCGGQWNTYEIIAKGNQLIARLNGVETASGTTDKHSNGPIALQFGSVPTGKAGAIKWRRVAIEKL